jgi:hypothetical protein
MILPITYAEILNSPNAPELLEEYSAECALEELGAINPKAETYAAMERTGNFQCFGAYEEHRLVGFASALVYVVPHYDKRIATVESLFVARVCSGWIGGKLLAAIADYGRKRDCEVVLYSAPVRSRLARMLFSHEPEYRNCSHVFIQRLR